MIVQRVIPKLLDHRVRKKATSQRLSRVRHSRWLPLQAALREDDVVAVLSALVSALMPRDQEPDLAVTKVSQVAGHHAR